MIGVLFEENKILVLQVLNTHEISLKLVIFQFWSRFYLMFFNCLTYFGSAVYEKAKLTICKQVAEWYCSSLLSTKPNANMIFM